MQPAQTSGKGVPPGVYENDMNSIAFSGSWSTMSNSRDSGGSVAFAKVAGDSASITFTGTSIIWISRTGPALGIAEVRVDGAVVASVDLYSAEQQYKQEVFRSAELTAGDHSLTVTRTGKRSTASRGNDISVDAFLVVADSKPAPPGPVASSIDGSVAVINWAPSAATNVASYSVKRIVDQSPAQVISTVDSSTTSLTDPDIDAETNTQYAVTAVDTAGAESDASTSEVVRLSASSAVGSGRYEESAAAITKVGTWATLSHSSDSGGKSANAKAIGNYAQLMFTGNGVEWIGRKGASLGKADVFLDDKKVATVDLYSSTQLFQQRLFSTTSLSAGTHTLRVVRSGEQNSASKGKDISLDSFVVSDTTPPPAPKGVAVNAQREGLNLTWTKSTASDTVGYIVYRAAGTGTYDKITVGAPLTGTSFLDIGLTYGTSYRYTVAAIDSSGNMSARSTAVTRTQPAPSPIRTRLSDCPSSGKTVTTLTQLRAAVSAAVPGTVIKLAPGTYRGGITVTASGTKEKPIWICGPSTAILDNGNFQSKNGVLLQEVSYVNVAGFTVQNFRKGAVVSNSSNTSIADLTIREIGEEALKIRYNSSDTVIQYNTVRGTGRAVSMYGEGVYIGTSPQNWCDVLACKPDASVRTQVIGNDIAGTTADPIEAKPATSSGTIRGNKVDGAALKDVTSLIAVKGRDYLVTENIGTSGKGSGIVVIEAEVKGEGSDNFFANNSMRVPRGSFAVDIGPGASGNIVDCTNKAPTTGSSRTNAASCQK